MKTAMKKTVLLLAVCLACLTGQAQTFLAPTLTGTNQYGASNLQKNVNLSGSTSLSGTLYLESVSGTTTVTTDGTSLLVNSLKAGGIISSSGTIFSLLAGGVDMAAQNLFNNAGIVAESIAHHYAYFVETNGNSIGFPDSYYYGGPIIEAQGPGGSLTLFIQPDQTDNPIGRLVVGSAATDSSSMYSQFSHGMSVNGGLVVDGVTITGGTTVLSGSTLNGIPVVGLPADGAYLVYSASANVLTWTVLAGGTGTIRSGLVAEYLFAGGSELLDTSGHGNTLTNAGTVTFSGGVATFNGSNWLYSAATASGRAEATYALTVTSAMSGQGYLLGENQAGQPSTTNAPFIKWAPGDVVDGANMGVGDDITGAVDAGTHSIIFRLKSDGTTDVWIDGTVGGTGTWTGPIAGGQLLIGSVSDAGNCEYIGDVSKARVWNRAITDAECATISGGY